MHYNQLAEAVQASRSYRQVGRILGACHHTVKKAIEAEGIDVSHFDFGRRSLSYVEKVCNKLTIREVFKGNAGRWFCRCDCQCGSVGVVKRLDGVLGGHIPSCGCAYLNRSTMTGEGNPAFSGIGELSGSRVYWIKRGAQRRGIEFFVTKEYLWNLFEAQEASCALSGVKLTFGRMRYSYETTASLDRIDSTKGYIEGNLQWVHKDVNKIKRDIGQDYFLELCYRISDHTRKSNG